MSISYGPKLGLINNADIGETYYDDFRPFLRAMDELIFCAVINSTTTTPPGSPNNGDAYLLLGSPTGAWAGQINNIAIWSTEITDAGNNTRVPGWDFRVPNSGWLIWDQAAGTFRLYNDGWEIYATAQSISQVALTPTNPGNFTVAHGLSVVPSAVSIQMTSGGQIWFQTPSYDATNLYLVASDSGLTASAAVWS